MRRVIIIALAVLAFAACGGDDDDGATERATSSTRASTTTSTRPVAATSTTAQRLAATPENAKVIFSGIFNETAPNLETAIKADPTTEALRSFTYDQATNVVRLDLLSKYQGPENFRSIYDVQAWNLASALSQAYWNPDTVSTIEGAGGNVGFLPAFHQTLDAILNYECPPDLMAKFAAKQAGQEDFNAQCVK